RRLGSLWSGNRTIGAGGTGECGQRPADRGRATCPNRTPRVGGAYHTAGDGAMSLGMDGSGRRAIVVLQKTAEPLPAPHLAGRERPHPRRRLGRISDGGGGGRARAAGGSPRGVSFSCSPCRPAG